MTPTTHTQRSAQVPRRFVLLPLLAALCAALIPAAPAGAQPKEAPKVPAVGAVPKALRDGWKIDAHYAKHADAGGVPVLASKAVADEAVAKAANTVLEMLANRPDVLKALAAARIRVSIIGKDEQTTDLPEYAGLRVKAEFWNKRSRGLGATPAAPASSAGEENILGLPGDRYKGESILVHEFAHTVHTIGLNAVDKTFEPRLKELYAKAMKKGLWEKTYAATDYIEYWGEGVQSYFDANRFEPKPNGIHNDIATRDALKKYDPSLFELIDTTLKAPKWKWVPPTPPKP